MRKNQKYEAVLRKINKAIQDMESSKDLGYTASYVPVDKTRGFSIECDRIEDDLIDGDGNIIYERKGAAVGFVVYYQVNGSDRDSCSLSYFSDEENMKSVAAFVKMYV